MAVEPTAGRRRKKRIFEDELERIRARRKLMRNVMKKLEPEFPEIFKALEEGMKAVRQQVSALPRYNEFKRRMGELIKAEWEAIRRAKGIE